MKSMPENPPFTDEEIMLIHRMVPWLEAMVESYLAAPRPTRKDILNLSEGVECLRQIASGNANPLEQFLTKISRG